jgi:hypothetical protein
MNAELSLNTYVRTALTVCLAGTIGLGVFKASYAKFSSSASNINNQFAASTAFPTPTPTITPTPTVSPNGSITVNKTLSPTSDSGKFNLLIDTVIKATNQGNGGTTGQISVSNGNHTAGETAGTSTSLENYLTNYFCKDGTTTIASGTTTTTSSFSISSNQNIICTFNNFNKTTATCANYCSSIGNGHANCIKQNDPCTGTRINAEGNSIFNCSGNTKDCCCTP